MSIASLSPERMPAAAGAPDALIADTLARFAVDLQPSDIPAAVRRRARHLVLDGVGIALASTGFDFAQRTLGAIHALAGDGETAVIGSRIRLPLRDAAFVNGFLIHGLDFDDTHTAGILHGTCSIFPTTLAVAARERASGRDLLAAYVVGIEAAARLGAVAKGAFHQIGFHPTGLIGAFGCALTAGRLMRLTAPQLAMAQGIVLSFASGSLEFLEDGAWNKRAHPGWAAVAGITAAALAQAGFVGARRAYEGRFGLFNSHLQDRFDPADLGLASAGLGKTWELLQVAVKPYPACHFTHACADAAVALAREERLEPDAIAQVRALVPAEVVQTVCEPVANKRRPANSYDAQFSIPFITAASLVRGRFTLAELDDATLHDPAILALADRIDYAVDRDTTFPRHYSGEVIVHTRDGRTLRRREAINRGCGDRPLAEEDIVAKFAANAGRAVAADRVCEIADLVLGIEDVADCTVLAEGLRAPPDGEG
jgi:2-methylcitrate dehydratase PrpD